MDIKKLDLSPAGHAFAALLIQVVLGCLSGSWFMGGVAGAMWFIAREHTQAEYRWIANYGSGHRVNMPWYGSFDLRVWDWGSVLDFLVPCVACLLLAVTMNLVSGG